MRSPHRRLSRGCLRSRRHEKTCGLGRGGMTTSRPGMSEHTTAYPGVAFTALHRGQTALAFVVREGLTFELVRSAPPSPSRRTQMWRRASTRASPPPPALFHLQRSASPSLCIRPTCCPQAKRKMAARPRSVRVHTIQQPKLRTVGSATPSGCPSKIRALLARTVPALLCYGVGAARRIVGRVVHAERRSALDVQRVLVSAGQV